MSEQWKDIAGYEGLYQVSDHGRLKRLAGTMTRTIKGTTFQQRVSEKILVTTGPYPMVALCKDGVREQVYAHHEVAAAFIGERPSRMQVCHNDGNPKNPHVDNLRYDTPIGNAKDRHEHDTHAIGEANPASKYPEEMIANVKHDLLTIEQFKVAALWELPKSTVRSIKQGVRWGHVEPVPEEPLFVIEM